MSSERDSLIWRIHLAIAARRIDRPALVVGDVLVERLSERRIVRLRRDEQVDGPVKDVPGACGARRCFFGIEGLGEHGGGLDKGGQHWTQCGRAEIDLRAASGVATRGKAGTPTPPVPPTSYCKPPPLPPPRAPEDRGDGCCPLTSTRLRDHQEPAARWTPYAPAEACRGPASGARVGRCDLEGFV